MRTNNLHRFLFVATACLVCASYVAAAPTVSILPAGLSVSTGQTFQLAVEANAEAGNLSCFSVTLNYDPTMLQLVGSSEGTLFTSALDPTFYQQEQDSQGDDVFSACVLGFGTSVVAPGELFTVSFFALNDGNTTVDVQLAELRDIDRALIPGVLGSGSSVGINLTATPPANVLRGLRLLSSPNPASNMIRFRVEGVIAEKANSALLSESGVELYDVAGRRVRTSPMTADAEALRWDLRDERGERLAAGMYFAVVRADGRVIARTKLLVVD